MPPSHPTILHALRGKFLVDDDCWVWQAATHSGGYGVVRFKRKNYYAHRVMYEMFVGPIPDGMELDHLCRNRACVRPDHLEPVTTRENQRRGIHQALKTHCAQGHPWVPANIYVRKNGWKMCGICMYERAGAKWNDKERTNPAA